ncbi:MAG: hypothetical protein ACLR56_04120 [Oscillospiraceae bacterium]
MLKEAGYNVSGSPCAFMTARGLQRRAYQNLLLFIGRGRRARGLRAARYSHYAFNFKESFEKDVISDFINEYKRQNPQPLH